VIPFNKPFFTGKEADYIRDAVNRGKISGDGHYTLVCHHFFQDRFNFKKVLLTTSCTDALEMAAILINIQPGDEVIMPSYTFVSTANAFVLRGARIVFADSNPLNPNMDAERLETLITPKTKAIVPVHYAGIACDMDKIMELANKYKLFVIEDAAQAVDSYYKQRPLGGIGHLAAFSFHETKNVISGEGGMLVINDERFIHRAEIIREKGTNRSAFFRGEVDKYGWVDMGSSFLPSDIIAAFLFAQLENLDAIQARRKEIWQYYQKQLEPFRQKGFLQLPHFTENSTNNAHMYYVVLKDLAQRTALIQLFKDVDIHPVFHYLSLHKSPFYVKHHGGRVLPNSDRYSDTLLRLPFYHSLSTEDQDKVLSVFERFFSKEV
jgi:dTDP-4-amino-4,6-dideoxygalactose transaminase